VGDIPYLWAQEGWLYLVTIIDLYSRAVIGWSISRRVNAALVCDVLTMALWRRDFPTQVVVHSDRRSQYCSNAYQKLLKDHARICAGGCQVTGIPTVTETPELAASLIIMRSAIFISSFYHQPCCNQDS